jgi:hypothetical protein
LALWLLRLPGYSQNKQQSGSGGRDRAHPTSHT